MGWLRFGLGMLAAAVFLGIVPFAEAKDALVKITISVPGPRNLSYLPIDLIPRIGADREEGAEVRLLPQGGGGMALQELVFRNSDFAVAGMPAVMSQRVRGAPVVSLAAVDDLPLFVLMVRADLRDQVRSVADLSGRVIGVNSSSLTSKTTSQQLAELLLRSSGVSLDNVRFSAAGQSWAEQSSIVESATADAIMGDEPFASRLLEEGKIFFLANLSDPETTRTIPGAGFLHAVLNTREEMVQTDPDKVARMVRILRRSLEWIARHSPEEVVAALGPTDEVEKAYFIKCLSRYRRLYSPDGAFSKRQLEETEQFFKSSSAGADDIAKFKIESIVVDRWVGRKE
ncbi:MAG: ABC transporter substrate-binding protein [Alphaproteobacteria bacterium]